MKGKKQSLLFKAVLSDNSRSYSNLHSAFMLCSQKLKERNRHNCFKQFRETIARVPVTYRLH